jgi:hypothetical protein
MGRKKSLLHISNHRVWIMKYSELRSLALYRVLYLIPTYALWHIHYFSTALSFHIQVVEDDLDSNSNENKGRESTEVY